MSHVDIRFTDKNSERFMLCLLYTSDAADE